MSIFKRLGYTAVTVSIILYGLFANSQEAVRLGTPVSEEQLAEFDLIAAPDGSGFPEGSGTAREGKAVYATKCAACHAA